ncbi:hypothetical protein JG688_00013579 [Phytophthora aleatoria]|uniref:Uncharacterized protein n=1 Tax=Phytophthora aleatoria TaxID=2496075 RepID=A0A8J5MEC2_9STRA|nr:hypothetical protein JG688_00013579 [Phytophthora aleatoria]
MVDTILAKLKQSDVSSVELEVDCRLAQLVARLSTLLALRERTISAPAGVYTDMGISEVNTPIAHVRIKNRPLPARVN